MNSGMYDLLVHWSELTACTMDDAMMFMAFALFIFYALLGWAFGFVFDIGSILYEGMKELFRFIRRQFRRKEKDEP